jgi:DNA-binding NarL/FixJ family response regulator
VLIADDAAIISSAISLLLSPSCDVVGCVARTDALLEMTPQLRPDVVLLDFSLRGTVNALEACRRITAAMPEVKVVAFTAHDDADFRRAAYDAGASGYVWKLLGADELLRTIQTVVGGTTAPAGDSAN